MSNDIIKPTDREDHDKISFYQNIYFAMEKTRDNISSIISIDIIMSMIISHSSYCGNIYNCGLHATN